MSQVLHWSFRRTIHRLSPMVSFFTQWILSAPADRRSLWTPEDMRTWHVVHSLLSPRLTKQTDDCNCWFTLSSLYHHTEMARSWQLYLVSYPSLLSLTHGRSNISTNIPTYPGWQWGRFPRLAYRDVLGGMFAIHNFSYLSLSPAHCHSPLGWT